MVPLLSSFCHYYHYGRQSLYRSNQPLVKIIALLVPHMVPATAKDDLSPFQGVLVLDPFGGPPVGSQVEFAKFRPVLGQILAFLTPHPANRVNLFLSKMGCRGVSHIVLQVLCSTGTFLQKGPFPHQNWLKICVWTPKHLLEVTQIFFSAVSSITLASLLQFYGGGKTYLWQNL